MFSRILSTAVVVGLAAAQTFSECNPVKGDKCKTDPAVTGGSVEIDFTKGASDWFTLAGGTTLKYDGAKGAVFQIDKEGQAPTITSKEYIFFGKVDAWIQASAGVGVVTSFVLQSDDLDEIDWEWLGGDTVQVQTNYFSKGDTTTYDRGGHSPVGNPQAAIHKYTIDWSPTKLVWLIDDVPVRTLTFADAKGGSTYPQTPMQIKLGTWVAGGADAAEGTVSWAGGKTDFGQAPFIGYYQKVSVTDYQGGNGKTGATAYEYGDQSGTAGSIIVHGGGSTGGSKPTETTSAQGSKTSSKATTSSSTSSASTSSSATTLTTVTTPSSTSSSTSTASSTASTTVAAGVAAVSPSATADVNNAPQKAGSGKVAFSVTNAAVMGAAVFFGALLV